MAVLLPGAVAAESESAVSGDIFGMGGGYVHGYLSLAEQWTDNLFYTSDEEESDFVTYVSPGIRLSLPGTKEELLSVSGSTTAPGGMSFGRSVAGRDRRFQAYLSYGPEFEFYNDNSDENTVTHLANGLVAWRLRSGPVLELIDQWTVGYEDYDKSISGSRDEYTSNLLGLTVQYPVGTKLDLRVDYQNYQISYDAAENDDRDRMDNGFSGYVFFKVRPKTAVFVQYRWVDIDYDLDDGLIEDRKDQRWYGGIRLDMTAKTSGTVKFGYGQKDFDDSAMGSESDIAYEAQIDHRFSSKTSAALRAYSSQEETTVETTDYTLTHFVGLGLAQKMTYRIRATVDLDYTQDEYRGGFSVAGDARQRDDQTYSAVAGLNYAPRGWLSFGLEYGYEQRSSNFDESDYTSNRVMLRITGAL